MTHRKAPWSVDEVLKQLANAAGSRATDIASLLLAWADERPHVTVTGGSGGTNGTLWWNADAGQGEPVRILLVYAYPTSQQHPLLEIDLKAMRSVPPYDVPAMREQLKAKLAALDIPRLESTRLDMDVPNLYLDDLERRQAESLLGVIGDWLAAVNPAAIHEPKRKTGRRR